VGRSFASIQRLANGGWFAVVLQRFGNPGLHYRRTALCDCYGIEKQSWILFERVSEPAHLLEVMDPVSIRILKLVPSIENSSVPVVSAHPEVVPAVAVVIKRTWWLSVDTYHLAGLLHARVSEARINCRREENGSSEDSSKTIPYRTDLPPAAVVPSAPERVSGPYLFVVESRFAQSLCRRPPRLFDYSYLQSLGYFLTWRISVTVSTHQ